MREAKTPVQNVHLDILNKVTRNTALPCGGDMIDDSLPVIGISVPDLIPDARVQAAVGTYASPTCLNELVRKASEVYGLVSGLDQEGTAWLRSLATDCQVATAVLVLALYPGCRTWDDVLTEACDIQETSEGRIRFGLLAQRAGPARPGNVLWLREDKHHPGTAIIGNIGNFLVGASWDATDAVVTLPLTTVGAEKLRKWMDWIHAKSTPLTRATLAAPRLVPAEGTEEGRRHWKSYVALLDRNRPGHQDEPQVVVDPKTGEVSAADQKGQPVSTLTSAGTIRKVDPVLEAVQGVLSGGHLVSIDRVQRPPPLDAPLSPEMFGERRDNRAGAITRRQQFTISLFDEETRRALDNRRSDAARTLARFSLMLQENQRWMPQAAFPLFEKELDEAARRAMKALGTATNNASPADFVNGQRQKILSDCQSMLTQLGRSVAPDKALLEKVVAELLTRLEANVGSGMRTKLSLGTYQLVDTAREELQPWGTIQTFLAGSARLIREALVDPFHFRGLVAQKEEFVRAFNLFDDPLVVRFLHGARYDTDAKEQLRIIKLIEDDAGCSANTRCNALWKLTSGEPEGGVLAALRGGDR
jgi:hypothetical protein